MSRRANSSGVPTGIAQIVGGQAQSVTFWTPWCVLLNPFLPRRILKRSICLNDPGSISKNKSTFVNATPKPQQQASTSVMKDVAMSDGPYIPAYLPLRDPPLAASTAKLNPSLIRTPRFPSIDRLQPPQVRLPNEHHLPNEILYRLIRTFSLTQQAYLSMRTQGRV